ncbi:MAG: phage holin family protein [Rhodoferax sp.]
MRESPKTESSSRAQGQGNASPDGLLASLKQLLKTLLETVQVRLELIGTELELEKSRLFDVLVMALLALVFLALGMVLLCGTVILLFPDGWRLAAAAGMAMFFLAGGLGLLAMARRRLRNPSGVFHASAKELARDREAL